MKVGALTCCTFAAAYFFVGFTGYWQSAVSLQQAFADAALPQQIPFVGCPSDGQQGPVDAPKEHGSVPSVPATAAGRLAYYASRDVGVLAPRGWHCFGLEGSDGAFLIVTPETHTRGDFLTWESRLSGPAVQLSYSFGDTSGRFSVAQVAGALFPIARDFTKHVIDAGLATKDALRFGPFPDDVLVKRSNTIIEFHTPARHEGLGTHSRMAKNNDPISGAVILLPEPDMDMVELDIRMPPDLSDLGSLIVQATERQYSAHP